jgi:8-oxo-dGTP pyrophosphatase MutT (NUDIX family)
VSRVVRAAGGVVIRDRNSLEVLIVHRPQYDDWSFPKGKAEPDESDEACALREVEEETGLVCVLGEELPATEYTDSRGRAKRVRYWRMDTVGGELAFRHEVDDARWVTLETARSLLSYRRDSELLAAVGNGSNRPS